jgi:hypothetical protein
MFESVKIKEARSMVLVKSVFKLVVGAYLVIGLIAGYRAWFQVKSLHLQSTNSVLRRGSTIETTVVTYARTPVDVRVELIQGAHAETFAIQQVPDNIWAFFDPRTRQASQSAVLTEDFLGRFEPGKAQVRATATGRPQLTRLPPPLVRELTVEIQSGGRQEADGRRQTAESRRLLTSDL